MLITSFPIAVAMQRRAVSLPWLDAVWEPAAVMPDPGGLPPVQLLEEGHPGEGVLYSGLHLELHRDETDGYFENWAAPQPKVFLMWRMQDARAVPALVSVSYAEGARMLDSGELAGAVAMPPEIYDWLSDYLCIHYKPRARRGRGHG